MQMMHRQLKNLHLLQGSGAVFYLRVYLGLRVDSGSSLTCTLASPGLWSLGGLVVWVSWACGKQ